MDTLFRHGPPANALFCHRERSELGVLRPGDGSSKLLRWGFGWLRCWRHVHVEGEGFGVGVRPARGSASCRLPHRRTARRAARSSPDRPIASAVQQGYIAVVAGDSGHRRPAQVHAIMVGPDALLVTLGEHSVRTRPPALDPPVPFQRCQHTRGLGHVKNGRARHVKLAGLASAAREVTGLRTSAWTRHALGIPNLACLLLKDESERRNFILQEVAERKLQAFWPLAENLLKSVICCSARGHPEVTSGVDGGGGRRRETTPDRE
jgi:hypothetical protein